MAKNEMAMKISVVVPAFNEEKLLGESLRSIRAAMTAFAALSWNSELIVCDNNSSDRTAESARAAGAMVVFEPVNQISRARNCGAAAATGDWLIFVDADSCPSRELFAAVAAQIQSGKCVGGGATVILDQPHGWFARATLLWNCVSRLRRWAAGSFIFCEAAVFRQMGGFSQELFVSEEIEFSQRLKKLARETKRNVVILHRHPLKTSARKLFLYRKRDYAWFLWRTILGRGQTLKNRAACTPWYDGRR